MKHKVKLSHVYVPSQEIVTREIQGKFIMIPITSMITEVEDGIFTLNVYAKAIWDKLDGKNTIVDVVNKLRNDFIAPEEEIKDDVIGFVHELVKRRMLVKVTTN